MAEPVAHSFATSLSHLQTPYLDGLVLHSPFTSARQTREAWQAMEAIFQTGAARQLGISNCYALDSFERFYRQATIKPALIQNRFYAKTHYDREICAFCRHHHILYQSFWTLTANPRVLAHATLQALASKYQRARRFCGRPVRAASY